MMQTTYTSAESFEEARERRVRPICIVILCLTVLGFLCFAMNFVEVDIYYSSVSLTGFELMEDRGDLLSDSVGVAFFVSFICAIFEIVFALLGALIPTFSIGTGLISIIATINMCEVAEDIGEQFVGTGISLFIVVRGIIVVLIVIAMSIYYAEDRGKNIPQQCVPEVKEKAKEPPKVLMDVSLPVMNYYDRHSFRVVSCRLYYDDSMFSPRFNLRLVSFREPMPTALQLQLRWRTMWGDELPTQVFTCFEIKKVGGYYETEWFPAQLAMEQMKEIRSVKHTIHKVLFAEAVSDIKQAPVDIQLSPEELLSLRKSTMGYAVCQYKTDKHAWQCYCGKAHFKHIPVCDVCHYSMDTGTFNRE